MRRGRFPRRAREWLPALGSHRAQHARRAVPTGWVRPPRPGREAEAGPRPVPAGGDIRVNARIRARTRAETCAGLPGFGWSNSP